MPNWSEPLDFVKALKSANPPPNDSFPKTAANGSGSELVLTVVPPGAKGSLDAAESFTARSETAEEQLKGSVPPSWEPNGSASPVEFTLPPNRSESATLFPEELKGSLATEVGSAGLEAKRSESAAGSAVGEAAVSLGLEANRSGSGIPVVVLNGSAGAEKGSSEEKGALEVCLKKESAAKGSDPLKGSPPNGSAASAFPNGSSLNGSWSVKGSEWKKSISGREGGSVWGGSERGPT